MTVWAVEELMSVDANSAREKGAGYRGLLLPPRLLSVSSPGGTSPELEGEKQQAIVRFPRSELPSVRLTQDISPANVLCFEIRGRPIVQL
jgi:hypothetical protein